MNKERLLNVAKALRESPEPEKFDMDLYIHTCGTPACAFGHYASRSDLQDEWIVDRCGMICAADDGSELDMIAFGDRSLRHFDITAQQADELFGPKHGCGGAKTAIAAAEYIEAFVARGAVAP
jgi:hypothetical protein